MSEPGLPELARAFLDGLVAADAGAVLAVAAPDLELRIPAAPRGVPRTVTGHDELAGLVAAIDRTWTSVAIDITALDTFAGDPARGVTQFTVRATNQDGTEYRNDYVALGEVAGGRIRRWTEYYDPAPMVAAIDALRAHVRAGR
jgi:ketosteroid isomerase-like protein